MIRITIAATSLLVLSACNAPEAASGPGGAPVPTSSPSAAGPVGDTVLTSEGLGPVRIGMTTTEVTSVWGPTVTPDAVVGGPEPDLCTEYHPARAPDGVNVMIQNGRLARITLIRDASIRTDRGFGLGDTGAAIRGAYGGAIIAQPDKYAAAPAEDLFAWSRGGSTTYVEDPNARGIRYQINGEGVAHIIHAGDPSIQLVEGCS